MQASSSSNVLKWVGCLSVALFARVLPFALGFDKTLASQIEFVTPTTSFKRVTEAIYLLSNNLSPYSGPAFLQPPLILLPFILPSQLFQHFIKDSNTLQQLEYLWPRFLFIAIDFGIALMIYMIADTLKQRRQNPIYQAEYNLEHIAFKSTAAASASTTTVAAPVVEDNDATTANQLVTDYLPTVMSVFYLLNPVSIATCVAMSTVTFHLFALAAAILFAYRYNNIILSTFFIAFSTYLTVYPFAVYFGIMVILINNANIKVAKARQRFFGTTFFLCNFWYVAWLAVFMYLSISFVGHSELHNFLERAYLYPLTVGDLTPNWGNFWYFFTEIFDYFRNYFLWVFNIHMLLYIFPLFLYFRHDGLFMTLVLVAITSLFKAYPSFGDMFFYITLLLSYVFHLSEHMRFAFFVSVIMVGAMIIGPVFYNAWIYKGTGNANFFYFLTLASMLTQVLFITEFLIARIQYDRLLRKKKQQ